MAKAAAEDMLMIQCEKIVNETWAKAALHYNNLQHIIEDGGPDNEAEQAIVMIAANAALQKMTLDKALDEKFHLEEMSLCGERLKRDCPCEREICLML